VFDRLDTDKSGTISLEEFESGKFVKTSGPFHDALRAHYIDNPSLLYPVLVEDAIKIFHDADLKPNARCSKGFTAIMHAAANASSELWPAHLHCIGEIYGMGGDLNVSSRNGLTPLMLAARAGYSQTVKGLHLMGADALASNRFGVTALYTATQNGDMDTLKVLKLAENANGEDVMRPDAHGNTAIDMAVENGDLEAVEFLVDFAGHHIRETQNSYGLTALDRCYGAGWGHIQHKIAQENLLKDRETKKILDDKLRQSTRWEDF